MYDDRWRLVTVYKETSTDPILYELNVPHNAGSDGFGGSSYIDSWALRERDKNLDETLETRTYYIQNWRADVISELTDALGGGGWTWGGSVRYSAYGEHEFLTLGDVSDTTPVALRDTVLTIDDYLQVNTWIGASNLAGDLDDANETGVPDGAVTTDDLIFEADLYSAGGLVPDNPRFLYAGYVHDPIIGTAASAVPSAKGSGLYHVRNRVYNPELGRWTRRDPLGYIDGTNAAVYCISDPIGYLDPFGLLAADDPKYSDSSSCTKATKGRTRWMVPHDAPTAITPNGVTPDDIKKIWKVKSLLDIVCIFDAESKVELSINVLKHLLQEKDLLDLYIDVHFLASAKFSGASIWTKVTKQKCTCGWIRGCRWVTTEESKWVECQGSYLDGYPNKFEFPVRITDITSCRDSALDDLP